MSLKSSARVPRPRGDADGEGRLPWDAREFQAQMGSPHQCMRWSLIADTPETDMIGLVFLKLSCAKSKQKIGRSAKKHNFRQLLLALYSHSTGLRAAGVSHDSPRTPNVHISGSPPSRTPKFHARTSKRGRKKENCGGREGKKKAKFWAVQRRGPAEGSGAPKLWTHPRKF